LVKPEEDLSKKKKKQIKGKLNRKKGLEGCGTRVYRGPRRGVEVRGGFAKQARVFGKNGPKKSKEKEEKGKDLCSLNLSLNFLGSRSGAKKHGRRPHVWFLLVGPKVRGAPRERARVLTHREKKKGDGLAGWREGTSPNHAQE